MSVSYELMKKNPLYYVLCLDNLIKEARSNNILICGSKDNDENICKLNFYDDRQRHFSVTINYDEINA